MSENSVVPFPASNSSALLKQNGQVKLAMQHKLNQSLLDTSDAKLLKFKPFTAAEFKTAHPDFTAHAAGFSIPYFSLAGKLTRFYRYRYLETTKKGFDAVTNKKALKYGQPPKTVNELYMPPYFDWQEIADEPKIPLVITEGELKSACACKHEIPTIGLGGVWCFKAMRSKLALLPQFDSFSWKDRTVYIAYDSDAITNKDVIMAENALAAALGQLGAIPYIVRLPPAQGGGKQGLDDYIVAEGVDAFKDLIATAEQWGQQRELFKMNEEVLLVRDPGFVLRLDTLQRIPARMFYEVLYANRNYSRVIETADGKPKTVTKNVAQEWLKWPLRAEVERMTYAPGQPKVTNQNEFNTWKGWATEPKKGDIKPWLELMEYLFQHDVQAGIWFQQWLAYPLQHPGTKMFTTAVLWGVHHGTGKSLVGYTMKRIYGENFAELEEQELHNIRNTWAEDKQFIMGEEITGGDKRGMTDRLKGMITREEVTIDQKYIKAYKMPDRINYYFTSNHPDAFFLEDRDRRFFVHEVSGEPKPFEFYKLYSLWLNGHGPAQLFHHLLNLDLTGFDPRAPAPYTESKDEMIRTGRSELGNWVSKLKEDPEGILKIDSVQLPYDLWRTEELVLLYDPMGKTRVTQNAMARELKRAGFTRPAGNIPARTEAGQTRLWAIRNSDKFTKLPLADLGKYYDNERKPKPEKPRKF